MDTPNYNPNQNVPVITPAAPAPKRKRVIRWLTLAAVLFLIGAGSLFAVVRNNNDHVAAEPAATVEITSTGIRPQTIKVVAGDSITWINEDTAAHHIAISPFGSVKNLVTFDSAEPLAQGESYTATFDKPGTYLYQDKLNPAMFNATVIVE